MHALRTFFAAGAVLAMATTASPASRQDVKETEGRVDRIAAFRADYGKLMDNYESIFHKIGNDRGLRLVARGRDSMSAVGDDQLAKMFQRIAVPDLSEAVQAADRLNRLASGSAGAGETPGLPGAPPILGDCNNISHSSSFTFGALVAFQVARTILAAAEFACEEVVVVLGEGGNGAAVCIPFAIAQDVAAIPFELADFCGGEEDSALAQGSYDRLEHIHTDLENVKSDIIASINANTQLIINNSNDNRDQIITNDNTNRDTIITNDNANRELILNTMRALSCDLERLVHTPEGQRKSNILECMGQPNFPFNWPEH